MPISFMMAALFGISLFTNLTVEGIKKLLDKNDAKYSSNILAAIVSVILSGAISAIYLVMNDIAFTSKIGVEIIILVYLGFLVSTVGYDKVIQTLKQIKTIK